MNGLNERLTAKQKRQLSMYFRFGGATPEQSVVLLYQQHGITATIAEVQEYQAAYVARLEAALHLAVVEGRDSADYWLHARLFLAKQGTPPTTKSTSPSIPVPAIQSAEAELHYLRGFAAAVQLLNGHRHSKRLLEAIHALHLAPERGHRNSKKGAK